MRKTLGISALSLLLIFLTLPSYASDNPEISWKKSFVGWTATVTYATDVGSGGSLRMKDLVGSITITGGKFKSATVVYELRIKGSIRQEEAEELLQEVIPEFKTSGTRITVYGQRHWRSNLRGISVSTEAMLPAKFDVNGETGGGSITVSGLEGQVHMSSGGGSITVESCQGDLDVSTGGGSISLTDVKGYVDVSTGGGSISLESVVADSKGRASTGGGSIDLFETEGSLRLSTGAGKIRIRGHKGDLKVSTGAGNIDGREVHGSLACSTGAGTVDVDVPMDKNAAEWTLDVSTGTGNVNVLLPGKLPATVYAIVNDPSGRSDIRSDFDLDISEDRWEGITGRGKINGGGMSVNLSSGRGRIHIRKS